MSYYCSHYLIAVIPTTVCVHTIRDLSVLASLRTPLFEMFVMLIQDEYREAKILDMYHVKPNWISVSKFHILFGMLNLYVKQIRWLNRKYFPNSWFQNSTVRNMKPRMKSLKPQNPLKNKEQHLVEDFATALMSCSWIKTLNSRLPMLIMSKTAWDNWVKNRILTCRIAIKRHFHYKVQKFTPLLKMGKNVRNAQVVHHGCTNANGRCSCSIRNHI